MAIDVGPTRLHHADPGLGEMMDGAQQEIFRGHEVGVEYGDELAFRGLHTFRQGPRLIAFAVAAMVIADWASPGGIALDQVAGDGLGFVRRIIEHLNVELVRRVIHAANRVQQPLDDEPLVKDGKLDGHPRKIGEMAGGIGGALLPMLVIKIDQDVAMHAVGCQQDQDHEIRDQQGHIEGIGLVEALEGGIEKVVPNILTEAVRHHERRSGVDRNRNKGAI